MGNIARPQELNITECADLVLYGDGNQKLKEQVPSLLLPIRTSHHRHSLLIVVAPISVVAHRLSMNVIEKYGAARQSESAIAWIQFALILLPESSIVFMSEYFLPDLFAYCYWIACSKQSSCV